MHHFRRTIADERLSRLPMRFWDAILRGGGKLHKRKVEEIFATEDNPLYFQIVDILDLLRSAGLISVESSVDVDPIRVTAIPSILTFEPRRARKGRLTLRGQLTRHLIDILTLLRSMSLDMFQRGGTPAEEGVFSAFITANLISRGWRATREERVSRGFADIKATHDRFPGEHAIIEVKIWPRNDYERIHRQALDYGDHSTTVLAAVMISSVQQEGYPAEYKRRCLTRAADVRRSEWIELKGPLRGYYRATSVTGPDVDHFLVQLPRRR